MNLETVYCASCDLSDINLEGCENLETLDCSNNKLVFLDVSQFHNLGSLKCSHQHAIKPLSRFMNFIDLLLSNGKFAVSAENEGSSYLENVKNMKAYDENGKEISVEYDLVTGETTFDATPSKITYDYDTGFENTMMDVEISALESDSEVISEIGPSHSGCKSGFGTLALTVLMLLFVSTSKTKIMK